MKRKHSAPDQLMRRMQRLTDVRTGVKRPRLPAPAVAAPTTEQPAKPLRLLLTEMRRTNDAAVVYKSPLATAIEFARERTTASGPQPLLLCYLATESRDPLWTIQRQAVQFMKAREADAECSGGMLCDEMGLGKSKDVLVTVLEQNQAEARATGRRFNGATLVVCRGILIANWVRELQAFPREAFEYAVLTRDTCDQYGADPRYLAQCCDLVFTTYSAVASTLRRHGVAPEEEDFMYTALFRTRYRRLVADEAHVFVINTTDAFRAMFELPARSHWYLSGTPIRNRRSDIMTPLRFIGLPEQTVRRANTRQLKELLARVMLRRTRDSLDASISGALVPRFKSVQRRIEYVEQRPAERALYLFYAKYALLRQRGTALKSIQMIQLLRQLCLSPTLVKNLALPPGLRLMGAAAVGNNNRVVQRAVGEDEGRTLTLERFFARWDSRAPLRLTYCGARDTRLEWEPEFSARDRRERKLYRLLTEECERTAGRWAVTEAMVQLGRGHPLEVTKRALRHIMTHTLRLDMPSSKQAAILAYVAQTPPSEKLIVFSNSVDFLVELNQWLTRAQHRAVLVTGRTAVRKEMNDQLLAEFDCDPAIKVLLITLKLGGEGLSITSANHVLIADPWWTPFILEQAENRVQRVSQRLDVHIVYFLTRDTIEEQMHQYLTRKKALLPELLKQEAVACRDDDHTDEEEEESTALDDDAQSLLFDYTVKVKRVQ